MTLTARIAVLAVAIEGRTPKLSFPLRRGAEK
jgi:hypothetical protein